MVTELSHSHWDMVHYERSHPELTALYKLVQKYVETFFAQVEEETTLDLSVAPPNEVQLQQLPHLLIQ